MRRYLNHIGGWQKHSFIDFPGTVATVLFFCGCNLRCPFCHNPSLVLGTEGGIPDPDTIRTYLEKRRGLIEGVVLSGGEPTIHASTAGLADAVRELGYRIKLDTNGLLPEATDRIAPDYLALDIKTRPGLYPQLMGAPFTAAQIASRLSRSVDQVHAMGEHGEIRITVTPAITDEQCMEEIRELISGVKTVYLQEMRQSVPLLDPAYTVITPPSPRVLDRFREMLAPHVGTCIIRGKSPDGQ